MRALAAAVALVAAFLFAGPASAEDPVITGLEVETSGAVTVGDRVTYVVTIEADPGVEFRVDQSSLSALVELVDTPQTTATALDDGRERVTFSFRLAAFAPGPIDVPPITLSYAAPDNGPSGELTTDPTRLFISSVLPPEPQIPPPRDLKPQAVIGQAPATWPLYALIGAVAALAFVLLALYVRVKLRRRRGRRAVAAAPTGDRPEDRARTVLDTAGAGFSLEGDYVEYYSSIGVTVRRYLTERYGFPAFALTTRELESEMLKRGLDRWQVRVASGLLEQCDAVIYANYRPAAERADADLTAAYEIVEMSRPVEPEPEEVAP